ncbi:hypothetical protein D3C72_1841680 [compost metagenome]
MHPARHFDGAAKGDFTIALREVQITDRQATTLHIHRKKHAGAARQVLDVAVAAMLAGRHGAGAFGRCAIPVSALQGAHVGGLGRGRIGQRRHPVGVGVDQGLFAPVPGVQQFFVWQAAYQAGVDQPREVHAGNMA